MSAPNRKANQAALNRLTDRLANGTEPPTGITPTDPLDAIPVSEIIRLALQQQFEKFREQQAQHAAMVQQIGTVGARDQGIDIASYWLDVEAMMFRRKAVSAPGAA